MQVKRLTPAIGALITNGNLSNQYCVESLHKLLTSHGVLFLRNQSVSDSDLIKFAQAFGPLEPPHPVYSPDPNSPLAIISHDENHPPDGAEWHSDCSWSKSPPPFSVLWPKLLPSCGGDTLWLSSIRAFETLPEGMKNDLRKLECIHDMGTFRNGYVAKNGAEGIHEGHMKFGSAIHPMVTVHPVTKQECLFVNEAFTCQVVGMMAGESRNFLNFLFNHLSRPDLQVRWKWELGDVVIWDNRNTQHYACADYTGHRRKMARVTVVSDELTSSMENAYKPS